MGGAFGEPTIIYGDPSQQRFDQQQPGQNQYDQQFAAQQQMLVNQGTPGMSPMYMATQVQQPAGMLQMQQQMVAPMHHTIVINSP